MSDCQALDQSQPERTQGRRIPRNFTPPERGGGYIGAVFGLLVGAIVVMLIYGPGIKKG